jgi:hypothetical protein
VVVTRDGSRVFLYAGSDGQAREAERVVRELIAAEALTAEVAVTRWHPLEERWEDASVPLPTTEAERRDELARREADEAGEAEAEGRYEWHVVVHLAGRDEAGGLADRLAAEGVPVARRWRWVVAGALTEERAHELAERVRAEAPEGSEVSVEVNPSGLRLPALLLLL